MKQYRSVCKKNWLGIAAVAALNILTSFAMVFAGYSLSFLFTAYEYQEAQIRAMWITFGIVLSVWLAAMGCYYLSQLATAKIQKKIKNDLRSMIADQISGLTYSEFVNGDSGHYLSWLGNDVEQLYNQSFASLFSGIENLATTIFSLAALILLSGYIGLAAVLLLIVISVLPQLTRKRLQNANKARSQAMELSTEGYKDAVMGWPVFRLENLQKRMCQRIETASQNAELVNYRFNRTNIAVQTVISTVSMVGQIILLLVTLLAAARGVTAAGAALSVGNLAGSFFNSAGALVQSFAVIKSAKPLWEKFEKKEQEKAGKKHSLQALQTIQLEHVSFSYEDRAVLTEKNLEFDAGEKYAVMGASGSGKSTLMKLILGLLPGYEGKILYDGVEQGTVDLPSLYEQIAYMDQQIYLFQDTLRFNITLGQTFSDEAVMAVIRKCCLESLVNTLPGGLDARISENGKNLSGGQRQRIALARGLIRNVRFVILDEGTSALDRENALEIENSLLDTPELGVIIITHNLQEEVKQKLTKIYCLD